MKREKVLEICLKPFGLPFIRYASFHAVRVARTDLHYHTHPSIQITLMLTGEMIREIKNRPRQFLRGGTLSLVQPGICHRPQYNIMHPCKYIHIEMVTESDVSHMPFSQKDNRTVFNVLKKAGNCVLGWTPELASIAQDLDDACQNPAVLNRPLQGALIRTLLAQLLAGSARAILNPAAAPKYFVVARACQLIEKGKKEYQDTEQLARAVGMGPSRFRELFRKETGQTVAEYRLRLSCSRARDILMQTSDSITKIAMNLGFSSSQYFEQCFRKYMGQSPSAFRKQYQSRSKQHRILKSLNEA